MNKKGFTLIELLVTIAIISLLSSIVFASISSARDKANVSKAKVQGKEIEKALELSRLSNNFLPVNTNSSQTLNEIVSSTETSEVKTAIEEYYSGPIPSVPVSISSPTDQDYYYISNNNEAIDSGSNKYWCGVRNPVDPIPQGVIFYKVKSDDNNYENKLFIHDFSMSPSPSFYDLSEKDDIFITWTEDGPDGPDDFVADIFGESFFYGSSDPRLDPDLTTPYFLPLWMDDDEVLHTFVCEEL